MLTPVKMIMSDGSEVAMDRCPACNNPRFLGYRCMGCDSEGWKEAYQKLRSGVSDAMLASHQLAP